MSNVSKKNKILVSIEQTRNGFEGRPYSEKFGEWLKIEKSTSLPVKKGMWVCDVKTIKPKNGNKEFAVFVPIEPAINQILYTGNTEYPGVMEFLVTNVIEIEKFPHLRADLQEGWSTTPDNTYKVRWVNNLTSLDQIEEMVNFLSQYENYSDLKEYVRYNVDHFIRYNQVHWSKREIKNELDKLINSEISLEELEKNLSNLDWKGFNKSYWGINNLVQEISHGAHLVTLHIEHPKGWAMWDGFQSSSSDRRKYTVEEVEKYLKTMEECQDFIGNHSDLLKSAIYVNFLEEITQMGGGNIQYKDNTAAQWAKRAGLTSTNVTIELGFEYEYKGTDDDTNEVRQYRIFKQGRQFGLNQKYYDLIQQYSQGKSLVKDRPEKRELVSVWEVEKLPFSDEQIINIGDFEKSIISKIYQKEEETSSSYGEPQ